MSGNCSQNLFDLSESVIIQLKKLNLVKKKLELKRRVLINTKICGLYGKINRLPTFGYSFG